MTSPRALRHVHSLADMRISARRVLPRPVFDFADGGAEDEATLAANERDFDGHVFLPKPLQGSPQRDLSVTLFDRRLAMPVAIGPTGLAGLFWKGGELAAGRAAATAGTAYCLSHASVCRIEDLPAIGGAPRWMQVFIYRDRGFTEEFVRRAAAARYDALVLTVDNQLLGRRERDLRNGFTIPPTFGPAEVLAMATKLPWLMRMRAELPKITFANYVREGLPGDLRSLSKQMVSLLDPSLSWADVEWLRRIWDGPFIVKGILHPDEARHAADLGVDAIVVSNHGGRQLDGAISSVEALPGVVAAVDGRIPVLLDGGVRRGSHVVKALCLGAAACLIGRPHLWGLSVAGEAGVAHVLETLRAEIDRTMGLLGVTRIADLGPHLLAKRA